MHMDLQSTHIRHQRQKFSAIKKDVRAAFVSKANFESKNLWVKEVLYGIRDEAMNDPLKALQASKAKKLVNQKGFSLMFVDVEY